MGSSQFSVHNGGRAASKFNPGRIAITGNHRNEDFVSYPALATRSNRDLARLDHKAIAASPLRTASGRTESNDRFVKTVSISAMSLLRQNRRTIRRLGLNIELRDARGDAQWRSELIQQGGRHQVPCLRLLQDDGSSRWLYESKEIIRYLERHYS